MKLTNDKNARLISQVNFFFVFLGEVAYTIKRWSVRGLNLGSCI